MFGALGNLTGLMKTAKELQANMARLQAEMAARRYDGDAGGGMVKATVDGRGTLVGLKIDPSAVSDVELLEDLIMAAVGSAVNRSQEAMKSEMAALTGGMNLPGLQEMLNGGK
jgi:DNA-binding YbaB/EbfC family protein